MARNKKRKKSGKVVNMLSPENYIRNKAKQLPIHECWINDDWGETGLSHITIVRRHSNANYSLCFYLVDLLCLGVKDTFFSFNIDEIDYKELLSKFKHQGIGFQIVQTDYATVHSIIIGAWKFAEDIGLQPHKDFLKTTKFFLENDENVSFVDIKFGENGKPVYVDNGFESKQKVNNILSILKKNLGEGNFDFISGVDNSSENDMDTIDYTDPGFYDETIEEFEKLDEQFKDLSYKEKAKLFLDNYFNSEKEFDITSHYLQSNLFFANLDEEKLEKHMDEVMQYINEDFVYIEEYFIDKLSKYKLSNDVIESIINWEEEFDSAKDALRAVQNIEKITGSNEFTTLYTAEILNQIDNKKYNSFIVDAYNTYPDSNLISLMYLDQQITNNESSKQIKFPEYDELFKNVDSITDTAIIEYISLKLLYTSQVGDKEYCGAVSLMLPKILNAEWGSDFIAEMTHKTQLLILMKEFQRIGLVGKERNIR